MKREFLFPSYDFVGEVLSKKNEMILFCYYRPNQHLPQRLICIIFTDKQITHGRYDWLESETSHPEFWDCLLKLVA